MSDYTYSDIRASDASTWPLAYMFDLHLKTGRDVTVVVKRETIDAMAGALNIDMSARDSYEAFAQAHQPEFAEAAHRKVQLIETIEINPVDMTIR